MTLSVYMWRSVFCDLWMFRRGSSKSKQKTHHHLVPKSLWDLHSACFHRVLSRIPDQFDLKSQIRPRTKQLEKSIGQYFLLFFRKMLSVSRVQKGEAEIRLNILQSQSIVPTFIRIKNSISEWRQWVDLHFMKRNEPYFQKWHAN